MPESSSTFKHSLSSDNAPAEEQFDWSDELAQGTKTIVKLTPGKGEPPLIIIHAGGTIHAYQPLRDMFKSALWAIQITPDTPRDSLYAQAHFYYLKIKELQPRGPYRLAAYSGTSMLAIPLAQMLEADGDAIIQLAFIDHFPTVVFCPGIGFHSAAQQDSAVGVLGPAERQEFLAVSFQSVCTMIRNDGDGNVPRRHKLADDLMGAFNGTPNSEFIQAFYKTMDQLLNAVFDFIVGLSEEERGGATLVDRLVSWLGSVKAPMTLYLASHGTLGQVAPEYREQWADLGARLCRVPPRLVYLNANHFDVLSDRRLIRDLQEGFVPAGANL
ncbi:Alpha/Beta hydrolase protein [Mycena sp. CBHHK59/15]|nr:Alpha/Beta hydrolase protein [Mycena sp. CBHHK59/15]